MGKFDVVDFQDYLALAVWGALYVRVLLSISRAFEARKEEGFINGFLKAMLGILKEVDKTPGDHGLLFLLSIIELVCYPVMFVFSMQAYIGGWLVLKTVVQWESWKRNRNGLTRYLIGNALIVIIALVFLKKYVVLP